MKLVGDVFDLGIIGDRIKTLRVNRNMGVGELAVRAGISRVCLWEIEQGKRSDAMVGTIVSIAEALGVVASDILDFDIDSTLNGEIVADAVTDAENTQD